MIQKKFARGLGALGAWAAGGTQTNKSPEHVVAEERVNSINTHRDSVLWLLRHRLQECVKTQQDMMEIRLMREMEKSRSVLAKSRRPDAPSLSTLGNMHGAGSPVESKGKANQALSPNEAQPPSLGGDLTEEQIQMFEKDNQDMLKFYESTLDQVRYVGVRSEVRDIGADILCRTTEKSLLEISELQTQLIDTLATQSAGIEQLVADSENTTENVGGGNRQLKQATQKASPAKYTFFATCGLCAFLIVWDLVI